MQSCQLWKVKRAKARGVKNFIVESNQVNLTNVSDLATVTDAFENYLYKYLYDELWEDDEHRYESLGALGCNPFGIDIPFDWDYDDRSRSYSYDYFDKYDSDCDNWDDQSLTFSCSTRRTQKI